MQLGAAERTTLDVVQTEAALAVLDHFTGTLRQAGDLVLAEQGTGIITWLFSKISGVGAHGE
jgi:hypothetical protein